MVVVEVSLFGLRTIVPQWRWRLWTDDDSQVLMMGCLMLALFFEQWRDMLRRSLTVMSNRVRMVWVSRRRLLLSLTESILPLAMHEVIGQMTFRLPWQRYLARGKLTRQRSRAQSTHRLLSPPLPNILSLFPNLSLHSKPRSFHSSPYSFHSLLFPSSTPPQIRSSSSTSIRWIHQGQR